VFEARLEREPQVSPQRAEKLQAAGQAREVRPVSAEPPVLQNLAQRAPGSPVPWGAEEPELAASEPEEEQAALPRLDQLAAFAKLPELLVSQQQGEGLRWQRASSGLL